MWDKYSENSSKYLRHGFPFILTGPLWVVYYALVRIGKPSVKYEEPMLVDLSKAVFPILFVVIILRSFVAEPFRIPSGSMIPTLEIGDFVLVKKYSYGIRLPIIHKKVIGIDLPKRGDVVVFRYPPKPKVHYIKRVIGLPGDHIIWTKDKKLIINDIPVVYSNKGNYQTQTGINRKAIAEKVGEVLPNDDSHDLILLPNPTQAGEWKVPENHYFMMGDNRDNSGDSRSWGFVPEDNLVGKASLVWMHWNWFDGGDGFQANRIGTQVN